MSNQPIVYFELCNEDAKQPIRQTVGAAGHDLYSTEDTIIGNGKRKLINTGLKIKIPTNTFAKIAPRSGLAVRGIDVGAGIIDEDYRGEIKVLLINNGISDFVVNKGDRIAQLLILPIIYPEWIQLEGDITNHFETRRGSGGFGSTGQS
jgi:dUTP pyrophosphatase